MATQFGTVTDGGYVGTVTDGGYVGTVTDGGMEGMLQKGSWYNWIKYSDVASNGSSPVTDHPQ